MATHKSAIKRHKQSLKRAERNRAAKSAVKTCIKKVNSAIEKKEVDRVDTLLKEAIRLINKTASKGIIHKNNASRKISRLTKKVNLLKSMTGQG